MKVVSHNKARVGNVLADDACEMGDGRMLRVY